HSRSVLVNGLSEETVVEATVYWWQPALIALCAVCGAFTAISFIVFLLKAYRRKEETAHEEA
ncbi:MAG: hypothetical protein IKQ24_07505, partial [Verrucomicrobia bacterium]|nr:hypothetical protein [Verrucomicrobiota bacterium]